MQSVTFTLASIAIKQEKKTFKVKTILVTNS